jgi:hypothetical protein
VSDFAALNSLYTNVECFDVDYMAHGWIGRMISVFVFDFNSVHFSSIKYQES